MHYVYLLENLTDKSWYIGYSSNLRNRLDDHLSGKGARTTRIKKQWQLIYYEAYCCKEDAIGRERFLKSGAGRKYLGKQLLRYLSSRDVV